MLTVSTLTYLKMILINSNHLIKSLQPAKKMRDTDISWRMELLEELKMKIKLYSQNFLKSLESLSSIENHQREMQIQIDWI
jgi:hypothetical protein